MSLSSHSKCHMSNRCLKYDTCPMTLFHRLVSGKWKILILWYLSCGSLRFSEIKRKLPDTLIINIEEYLPFAIWKTNGDIHLIDEEGKIISISDKEKSKFLHLIVVAGEDSKNNIDSLFNMLSSNPTLFSRIKSAIFVGKRRWNLELDNGIIIKMPEKNIINAWDKLDKILSINGSEIGIKSIDLRNSDKIFLEENK